jgi:peptidase S41-like protein
VGLADVIVLWNVLEHFWPYWDTVSVDWNAELDRALADALDDRSIDDHVETLERLSAAAPDGHAETRCPGQVPAVRPPFDVDLVERQIVVTASADPALAVGDVIVSIDGGPATERLAAQAALVSGSPQWRLVGARRRFGSGPAGSPVSLTIRRSGRDQPVTVVRTGRTASGFSHPPLERLDDGVYYVDLRRATLREIDENMDKLSMAPGIVFDVRGYPNNNHDVLSHLLAGPVDLSAGMAIPHVIRPDHVANWATSWRTESFMMPAHQPRFTGRVAFMTDARAYSYAESVMRLIEHDKLGEIVGAATAGTNGNMAEIAEPSGCRTSFTAMRVTRIDGQRSHLIGVQPTIAVSPTIAGVLAGRDEVLEKAVSYVRTGTR